MRKASFVKSAGAVVVNWYGVASGNYCRDCVWDLFRRVTGYTALLGWWSLTGLITTPLFLIWNTAMLLKGLYGRPVAEPPSDDPLGPYAATIREMAMAGATLDEVAQEIAPRAGISEAEVRRRAFPLQKYL